MGSEPQKKPEQATHPSAALPLRLCERCLQRGPLDQRTRRYSSRDVRGLEWAPAASETDDSARRGAYGVLPFIFGAVAERVTMRTRLPMEIVDRRMAGILAEKTEGERLRIGWGMQRAAVRMMRRILRSEHPDWTDEEVGREVARRIAHGG